MELLISIIIIAFCFELMDSCAGMGFGTGLTPLLFIMGYEPLQVVPVLLLSEAITGFTAGYFHHEFENVRFSIKRPLTRETKIMLMIALIGCCAIIFSVVLSYLAIQFPKTIIKTYVAILVLVMGMIGLIRMKIQSDGYRPRIIISLSALAGFNKGIGAGGYGPVIMMGQLFSGIYEKTASAIVSLSEGFVSLAGFASFILISSYGVTIDYFLLPSVFVGGVLAAILSPYLVRILPNRIWKIIIPVYAISIGIYLILNLYFL